MLTPTPVHAPTHPTLQLTKRWRRMNAEGQVEAGGVALSMEEIMLRLVDAARFDLQVRGVLRIAGRCTVLWGGV